MVVVSVLSRLDLLELLELDSCDTEQSSAAKEMELAWVCRKYFNYPRTIF